MQFDGIFPPLFLLSEDERNDDDAVADLPNLEYSCTLTPLFTIELLSNQSYILQLHFSPPTTTSKNDSSMIDAFGTTLRPALIKEVSLTIIVEDSGFHAALFYLKCLCVPFVLGM